MKCLLCQQACPTGALVRLAAARKAGVVCEELCQTGRATRFNRMLLRG